MKAFLILFSIIFSWFVFFRDKVVTLEPGIKAPEPPQQLTVRAAHPQKFDKFNVTPTANFNITAKILSKRHYKQGGFSQLSPIDIVVGWGKMSDEAVIDKLKIKQSNRLFWIKGEKLPISEKEAQTHSANIHIIPKTSKILNRVNKIKQGEIVTISGKLVNVSSSDGSNWVSSLSRSDWGARSAEILLVENISKKY